MPDFMPDPNCRCYGCRPPEGSGSGGWQQTRCVNAPPSTYYYPMNSTGAAGYGGSGSGNIDPKHDDIIARETEKARLQAIEDAKTPTQKLREKQGACDHEFVVPLRPKPRCIRCKLVVTRDFARGYVAGHKNGYEEVACANYGDDK